MSAEASARVDALCKEAPRYRVFTRLRRAMFRGFTDKTSDWKKADAIFRAAMALKPYIDSQRELTEAELWLSIQALLALADAREAAGLGVRRLPVPGSLSKKWRKWYSVAEVMYG